VFLSLPSQSFSQSKISNKTIRRKTAQSGFTLIEIMVVVVIIGILASVVVPRIMDNPDKARTAKAKNDIRALESAMDLYRLDNYTYPSTDEGLDSLVNAPSSSPANWKQGGYIKKLNNDPWGNDYLYDNDGGNIVIYTYGADGAEGGEGPNADISTADKD
jgi:general secretion pathway protein G